MVRRSACVVGCLLFCLSCGDGVIQRVSAPPKDRGVLEVLCVNERILVEYRGELLAGCGGGAKRAVIMPEGLYHLRFYAPGHYAQYKAVRVDAGKVTPIRIELLKAPR